MMLRAILHFLTAEIVCSVDKDQLPLPSRNIYNNGLNVISDLCRCKQTVYTVFWKRFFWPGQWSSCRWSSAPEF